MEPVTRSIERAVAETVLLPAKQAEESVISPKFIIAETDVLEAVHDVAPEAKTDRQAAPVKETADTASQILPKESTVQSGQHTGSQMIASAETILPQSGNPGLLSAPIDDEGADPEDDSQDGSKTAVAPGDGGGRVRGNIREAIRELAKQISELRDAWRENRPEDSPKWPVQNKPPVDDTAKELPQTVTPPQTPAAKAPVQLKALAEEEIPKLFEFTAVENRPVPYFSGISSRAITETIPAHAGYQIETEIIRNLEQGKMEFRMQLQPETLGKIDVRMVLEGGKLVIHILSGARTHDVLSRQIEALAYAIRGSGTDLTSVQIVAEVNKGLNTALDYNPFERGQDGDERQQGQNGQARHGANLTGEDEDSQPRRVMVQTGTRQLNYSV